MTCPAREICATSRPAAPRVSHFPLEVQEARAPLKALSTSMATVDGFLTDDFDAPRSRAFLRLRPFDFLFRPATFFRGFTGRLRLKNLPTCFEDALLRPARTPRPADLSFWHVTTWPETIPVLPMLFRLQAALLGRRVLTTGLAGSGLRHGPWCPPADQCLSSADSITAATRIFLMMPPQGVGSFSGSTPIPRRRKRPRRSQAARNPTTFPDQAQSRVSADCLPG